VATLTPSEEAELVAAVKDAAALVGDGDLDPTAAVEKVARDRGLLPGQVRLVCNAYNTGRQTAQMKANTSALDKFASFPLADADRVLASIYKAPEVPRVVAKAAAAPRPLEKAASVAPAPVAPKRRNLFDQEEYLRKQAEEAARMVDYGRDQAAGAFGNVVRYFKRFPHDRVSYPLFKTALAAYHGARGRALAQTLEANLPGLAKEAGDRHGRVDRTAAPYADAALCVELASRHVLLSAVKRAADKALDDHRKGPMAAARAAVVKKAAVVMPAMIGASVGQVTRGLFDKVMEHGGPRETDRVIDKKTLGLDDPNHQAELRKVRVQAMLSEMMSDENDPVSGYSPEEVAHAYNEIAQLTPHSSMYGAVMKPLLRRRLEGRLEPFETKEITDIEKGVREGRGFGARKPEGPK
jgi:hypothetical protein